MMTQSPMSSFIGSKKPEWKEELVSFSDIMSAVFDIDTSNINIEDELNQPACGQMTQYKVNKTGAVYNFTFQPKLSGENSEERSYFLDVNRIDEQRKFKPLLCFDLVKAENGILKVINLSKINSDEIFDGIKNISHYLDVCKKQKMQDLTYEC